MRGGKDEKMQLHPLFPRLHINDTEQGGPRPPPRNKMAVCVELNSASSQTFSSGSISRSKTSHSTNLVPSASLNHGHCQKMTNGLSLFYASPEASCKSGRFHSNYLSGMKSNSRHREYQMLKSGSCKSLNTRRPLSLHHPYRFYNSVNLSAKLSWKEDNFRILPHFGQREKVFNGGMVDHTVEKDQVDDSSSLRFSEKHQTQTAVQEQGELERTKVISREPSRNQAEYDSKVSEMLHPLPSADENGSTDADLHVQPINGTHESGGNGEFLPSNLKENEFVNCLSTLQDNSAQMHKDCRSLQLETPCKEILSGDPERLPRKRSLVAMEGPTCSSSSPPTGEKNRMPYRIKSVDESPKGVHQKSLHLEEVERSAVSDTSVVDSSSRLDITPDDVVRVIGPNIFWKIRRTIDRQQRIFAAQVFELHRIMQVQRLIARSPEMLLEGNVIFSKPSVKFFTETKLQRKIFPEPPALSLNPKVDSPTLLPCSDDAAEDVKRQLSPTDDNKKGDTDMKTNSILKPCSGSSTATSFAPEYTKFGPCLFQAPSGYQWLVPVRSPSEGLIYKPYSGPCPLTSGFIAPVYGGAGAVSLTGMDAAYGFAASKQQGIVIFTGPDTLSHSCFQTYAHSPKINTSNPDSAVIQLATTHSSNQYGIPCRNSCNMSRENGIMTDSYRNLPVSKSSDVHGSAISNLGERVEGDALSLFPTNQMSGYSDQNQNNQQNIQVIKVVPHNPKTASESAARIFQSIQEERKQHS